MDVDAIFLLGDTLDPAEDDEIRWLKSLIDRSSVPVHIVIGNHEAYGGISTEQFHRAFGLPEHGHHVIRVRGVPFLMLATPDQDSLSPGSAGYDWLTSALSRIDPHEDVFCCAHFSLLLHPCVQGWKNDGMQVLSASEAILALLRRHPNARAWIAGHKNVPSKVERDGVLHLLSPQLIQAPCGYRLLDIHPNGIRSRVDDIDEQDLASWSRLAYGDDYDERHGVEEDRDFWWVFPSSEIVKDEL
jgi:hypothetical protein